ncbi:ENR1 protein, partial [Anseranas semipalmata]|nr:ENR1 protein [Anseranas semipalmata]
CSNTWYNSHTQTFHPLGSGNTTYFYIPDKNDPSDLFPRGAVALKGHYWVCGSQAYRVLLVNWTGACYVGLIRPLFFLMPELGGKGLRIQL